VLKKSQLWDFESSPEHIDHIDDITQKFLKRINFAGKTANFWLVKLP
jgi:hypothetical protein